MANTHSTRAIKKLSKAFKASNWTMQKLTDKTGYTYPSVARLFAGKSPRPSFDVMVTTAKALKVSLGI
jgi:transcriptional regulator with XRE-family HTH domain